PKLNSLPTPNIERPWAASCALRRRATRQADLSQVALSWVSAPTPTVESNPRGCHYKSFPQKIDAATPSVAASNHRPRRFSLAPPPDLPPPAPPERPTTRRPCCP